MYSSVKLTTVRPSRVVLMYLRYRSQMKTLGMNEPLSLLLLVFSAVLCRAALAKGIILAGGTIFIHSLRE